MSGLVSSVKHTRYVFTSLASVLFGLSAGGSL